MSDLAKQSLQELKKLHNKVLREIESREKNSRNNLIRQIRKLAAEEGVELSTLLKEVQPSPQPKVKDKKKASVKAKKPMVPVYFNQVDPSKSWSGRGRKPEWVNTWLENGGDLDALKKRPS